MDLLLLFLSICIQIWCKDHPSKKELEAKMGHGNNIGLQYMYTVDECYDLRKKFDILIEPFWKAYEEGSMTEEEYKDQSLRIEKEMLGDYYENGFVKLYQLAIRNASLRVAREGYNPGEISGACRTLDELKTWMPDAFMYKGEYWGKCVPGNGNFLTLYPEMWELDYMICGSVKHNVWTPDCPDIACGGTHFTGYFSDKARKAAIQKYVNRGYDGKTYRNETPRDYGGLTDEQIKKKYKFIAYDPRWNYEQLYRPGKCSHGVLFNKYYGY